MKKFLSDYTLFEKIYLVLMILLQVIVFIIVPDSVLNIIAGISGVISVILCAKGKISFYYVGFIQTGIYLILSFNEKFYGEVIENIFYLVTMVYGVFIWKKNLNEDNLIKAKKFNGFYWFLSVFITLIFSLLVGYLLSLIGSNQAYIDACTNVLAFVAQILMIKGYKEQWLWWFLVNVLCLVMWFRVGNLSMVFMYVAWIVNCCYGWFNYNKLNKLVYENA